MQNSGNQELWRTLKGSGVAATVPELYANGVGGGIMQISILYVENHKEINCKKICKKAQVYLSVVMNPVQQ